MLKVLIIFIQKGEIKKENFTIFPLILLNLTIP